MMPSSVLSELRHCRVANVSVLLTSSCVALIAWQVYTQTYSMVRTACCMHIKLPRKSRDVASTRSGCRHPQGDVFLSLTAAGAPPPPDLTNSCNATSPWKKKAAHTVLHILIGTSLLPWTSHWIANVRMRFRLRMNDTCPGSCRSWNTHHCR
jgi:hypothetical protein